MNNKVMWVSTPKITAIVTINYKNEIIESAPIFNKFIGKPFDILINWLIKKFKTVEVKML